MDDFLVAVAYRNKKQGQKTADRTINGLIQEATKAGYNFSQSKCEGIHFRTRSADHITPKLSDIPIQQKDNIRWLGYWLSKDWRWNVHIEYWRTKAEKSGWAIRALTERYQVGRLNAW